MSHSKKLAILVGGGPAPGINSVIGAATIRGLLEDIEVLGIRDGFQWIMNGDIDHVESLTMQRVSRIHFRGGSYIGISRANPTKNPEHLENTVISLLRLGVDKLITIGGDDTCFSSKKLAEKAAGRIRVVHVPKTIDNDLDLPSSISTFGYQTARHLGVEIVKNLMVDAQTTSRWYFIISMGRKAGHLALGIGKAAGSTLTLIPEEFGTPPLKLQTIVDSLAGAIIKRQSDGRPDGVAVIAEGVVLDIDPSDLAGLESVERDAHGHLRIAEVNFGEILSRPCRSASPSSASRRRSSPGHRLRPLAPTYPRSTWNTRGTSAVTWPSSSSTAAPTASSRCRAALPSPSPARSWTPKPAGCASASFDMHSTAYAIARRYMIRLRRDDFADPHALAVRGSIFRGVQSPVQVPDRD
ncbi:MAG: 6-phosphofructokinase [Candidatus Eisenbacteria bacterium]